MRKKYIIKIFRPNPGTKFKHTTSKSIVVSYNTAAVNGLVLEKLGVYHRDGDLKIGTMNLDRLGYWLNKGASINMRPSWIVGILGLSEKRKYVE